MQDIYERVGNLQDTVLKMAEDPSFQPGGLTLGISEILKRLFDLHGIPLLNFSLTDGEAVTVYKPDALVVLTQSVDTKVGQLTGKHDFAERRKAVEGAIRSLLVAAILAANNPYEGDALLLDRVVPRIAKGAMLAVTSSGGRTKYQVRKNIAEVPYYDARILPHDSLLDLIRFMIDGNNLN